MSISPIHDAYLSHSTGYNSTIIRIEKDRREGYFMFDISAIKGLVEEAALELTVNSDSGNGVLQVVAGTSDAWQETTLDGGNKPAASAEVIGELSGDFKLGQKIRIPIDIAAIKGDRLTLLITQTTGNDVAFASKENSANIPPQLLISYKPNAAKTTSVSEVSSMKVYPNPAVSNAILEGNQLKGSLVQLYTLSGVLVHTEKAESNKVTIPTATLAAGVYFIKTLSGSGVTDMLRLGVN